MTDTPKDAKAMTDLRRANHKDIAAIARIVHTWISGTEWMTVPHSAEDLEGFIRAAFADREIWVAGLPAAGYMSIDPTEDRIGALYCATPGTGLGKQFIDKAKEGRTYLCLNTHMPNLAAQRFYQREGFIAAHELPPSEDGGPPELRMEWLREGRDA